MFDLFDLDELPIDLGGLSRPLIMDSFAGGGGASTGIEMALNRSPDVAINHDEMALSMHQANHPATQHIVNSVYAVDPRDFIANGQRVGLAWYSPDCKHHSKAKGGKPLNSNIRDLAWVVVHHAKLIRPEIIMLENVEEFQKWGPLDPETNRPIPEREGETFEKWVRSLRGLGYKVEWKELRAYEYGAPTIRKRLFLIARCDGKPIVWPEPTHGNPKSEGFAESGLKPWKTAADIIDWSIPCPSIFDTSEEIMAEHGLRAVRPLADNTMARIARGVRKYILNNADPFFVTYGQHGGRNRPGNDPLHTVTASLKDQNAIVVASFLAQHNAGPRMQSNAGRPAREPLSTLTTRGTQQQIVGATLSADEIEGTHARSVAAFLMKYFGTGTGQKCDEPVHTLTTKDRMGLVTVEIEGAAYVITDIGMRMLTPREQFRAQGFPDSYEIARGHDGRVMPKTHQTQKCGNSVPPAMARALVAANAPHLIEENDT